MDLLTTLRFGLAISTTFCLRSGLVEKRKARTPVGSKKHALLRIFGLITRAENQEAGIKNKKKKIAEEQETGCEGKLVEQIGTWQEARSEEKKEKKRTPIYIYSTRVFWSG